MAAQMGGFSGHVSLPGASRDGAFRFGERRKRNSRAARNTRAERNGLSGKARLTGQRKTREPARTAGWISCAVGPRSGRGLAFGTSAPP
ncbi:hypothetical protein I35_4741 [Burkholderia cenocepacia H111]|nr:hypothetical protein I35_4741 [Burkholderia cenocepacia H111]